MPGGGRWGSHRRIRDQSLTTCANQRFSFIHGGSGLLPSKLHSHTTDIHTPQYHWSTSTSSIHCVRVTLLIFTGLCQCQQTSQTCEEQEHTTLCLFVSVQGLRQPGHSNVLGERVGNCTDFSSFIWELLLFPYFLFHLATEHCQHRTLQQTNCQRKQIVCCPHLPHDLWTQAGLEIEK